MKKTIFLVGSAILATILLNATLVDRNSVSYVAETAEAKILEGDVATTTVTEQPSNQEIVENLVDKYSAKYGVSKTALLRTLKNENNTFEFCRQSEMRYKANNRWGLPAGTREQSYGVAQIHLPDNPQVSKAEACDPDFSVEFMAKHFAMGRATMWMGYTRS